MGKLGEAYIAVKADMRPFTQGLKHEVEEAVNNMEREIHTGLGRSLEKSVSQTGGHAGERLAEEFEDGAKRRFNRNDKKGWFVRISSALASALDDGISALPMEAKAAIVGALLLALPILSGALASLVSAALGAAFATIGVILAFQFEQVRTKATDVFTNLRIQLAGLAEPFIVETLKGLDQIRLAFDQWTPLLRSIFLQSALFVEPLTRGLLGMVDRILKSVQRIGPKLAPFIDELGKDFEILGSALGEFFELMAATGDEGRIALHDLIMMVAQLIVNIGRLLFIMAELYGWVRKIADAVPFLTGIFGIWIQDSDNAADSTELFGDALNDLNYQQEANVVATQKQQQAMEELVRTMDDAYNAAFALVDSEIAYEEALDRLTEAIKQNGSTFNITTKEGRENLRAFESALKAIHDQVMALLAQGKITSQQAADMQDRLTEALYKQAGAAGANTTQLHAMFDEAMAFADIPVGNQAWLDVIQEKAKKTAEALAHAAAMARALNNSAGLPSGGTRPFSEFAEGGIVNGPIPAIVGEAGPEVIIPLSKPGRAAQLARDSGLASMLGMGGDAPMVYVFIGNDQLDTYMVRVVDRNNKALGTEMAYGARGL
jgi:hypothetical protein